MPGIAGIFSNHDFVEGPQFLDAMLQSMMHETFYTRASHADQARGWFCGSVAIGGSYADCMPVFNETHDIALLLAGECFSEGKTAMSPGSRDHPFAPQHLVRMYEQEGPAFVRSLNGCLSGVILDTKKAKAVLFTDRYGIQKIYYHREAGMFVFASEAKALLRVLPKLKSVDPKSVAEYLCYDCVLENRTFFRDVQALPGGSVWVHERGGISKGCYFDPADLEKKAPLNAADFADQLTKTFASVLPRYLAGSKVAIALTGGLDTRLIMANLPPDCDQITTVTFGGMYRDSQDVRLARQVARACGKSHNVVQLGREFLSEYGRHAARAVYMSDGLADATNVDAVYLHNCSRTIAPVNVMGTFGSQVLGRVRRALRCRTPNPDLVAATFKAQFDSVSELLAPFQREHNLSYILKREIPWYWSRFSVPKMSQLTIRSPFLDNDLVDVLYRAPREGFDGSQFELAAISKHHRALLDIFTNKGQCGNLPPLISKVVGRLHKARALMEKTLSWDVLPYSLHHAVTRADSLVLAPLQLNKLVLGFEFFRHYNLWFRRELASYLVETLLDERTLSRPYWNADFVKRMVADHIDGRRRYLSEIRKVLTIELIHRVLIEGDVESCSAASRTCIRF